MHTFSSLSQYRNNTGMKSHGNCKYVHTVLLLLTRSLALYISLAKHTRTHICRAGAREYTHTHREREAGCGGRVCDRKTQTSFQIGESRKLTLLFQSYADFDPLSPSPSHSPISMYCQCFCLCRSSSQQSFFVSQTYLMHFGPNSFA